MLAEYQKIPVLYEFDGVNRVYTNEIADPNVKYLLSLPWLVSEKYDGMNIRVHYDGHSVECFGRTDRAIIPLEVNNLLTSKFDDSEVIFEQLFPNVSDVTLFMEAYGGKVQGAKDRKWYGGIDESLIGYDVRIGGRYLDRRDIKRIFDAFGIKTVEFFVLPNLEEAIKHVKESAKAQASDPSIPYFEGYVCTPELPLLDQYGHRIIVKVKTEAFMKRENLGKSPAKKKLIHDPTPRVKVPPTLVSIDQEEDPESLLQKPFFEMDKAKASDAKLGGMIGLTILNRLRAHAVIIGENDTQFKIKILRIMEEQ